LNKIKQGEYAMIIDLKETSGLNLKLDIDRPELVFGEGIEFSQPGIRTIDQMREVLLDKALNQPQQLYYMYRDVHRFSYKDKLEKNKLRYDVTVIKPFYLGKEFMKTAGHYHPGDFGELYELVYGRCFCLLQRPKTGEDEIIEEVIIVEAVAGQKIVIPPGFGHILINPGPDYLVTSNWVSSCFSSRYELYKKNQGAAYFITHFNGQLQPQSGAGALVEKRTPNLKINTGILKNPHLKSVAEIGFAKPAKQLSRFGLSEGNPIYSLVDKDPSKLGFLNHPMDYEYDDVFKYE
ncbi:MAG: glucose-6-phosphate isomerase family protein, partial [Candidatus Omnitrophota bacterium]